VDNKTQYELPKSSIPPRGSFPRGRSECRSTRITLLGAINWHSTRPAIPVFDPEFVGARIFNNLARSEPKWEIDLIVITPLIHQQRTGSLKSKRAP